MKKPGCPVCGVEGHACGSPGPDMGFVLKEATVGPLQLYEVQFNGYTARMRLNQSDAERMGGVPVTASLEADNEQPPPAAKKGAATRNKARASTNKDN